MTGLVSQLSLFGDAVDTTAAPAPQRWTWRPLRAPFSAATVRRFRAKVVVTPGCHYFTGAVSNPDGYGRNRAELHRFMHSTVRRYLATVHVK